MVHANNMISCQHKKLGSSLCNGMVSSSRHLSVQDVCVALYLCKKREEKIICIWKYLISLWKYSQGICSIDCPLGITGEVRGKGEKRTFTIYALELFEFLTTLTIFHCPFCASLLIH